MAPKPSLLLLPGLMCDHGIWRAQIDALADVADVRVPDFSRCDSIAQMAEAALAEVSGACAVAGHSMGGRVAFEILRRAPEQVTGLAFLNTGCTPRSAGEEQRRQPLLDLVRADGIDALVGQWLPPLLSATNSRREAVLEDFRDIARRAGVVVFENHMRALLGRPDATSLLPQIRCPTIFICGRQDAQSPLAAHAQMAAAVRGSTLVAIDECGHLSPMEAPDTVNTALRGWLNEVGQYIQSMRIGETA